VAALRSDYDFEDEAVALYGHFAYQAEDLELMELFKELARGEAGHRNGLRRTIRTVEDPATSVILFCPLCGWAIDFGPDPAEGTEGKCPVCPGRFALRLDESGDWTMERLAP
jgi:rubrerythrin